MHGPDVFYQKHFLKKYSKKALITPLPDINDLLTEWEFSADINDLLPEWDFLGDWELEGDVDF